MEPLNNCEDVDSLGRALDKYGVYKRVFETAIQGEQMEPQFHIEVNAVHKQFIRRTFPSLLQPRQEVRVSLREKGRRKDVEELYRAKHTERM